MRNMTSLRPHLPADFATEAAQLLLDHPGKVLIVTGFYILAAAAPETDGPPGSGRNWRGPFANRVRSRLRDGQVFHRRYEVECLRQGSH